MKQLFAAAFVAVLMLCPQARGDLPSDDSALRTKIDQCAAVKDALNRLECYDRLARQLDETAPKAAVGSETVTQPSARPASAASAPVPPAAQPVSAARASELPPPGGQWERKIERDDKGKITKVTLRLPAASEKGGIGGDPATLVLRCMSRETSVAIDWQNNVGENGVPVTLRIDDGEGIRKLWQVSLNGAQTMYPGNAVELIRRWRGARALHAQIAPYGGYPMDATFDLTGLAGALAPLRSTCRW